jgi:ABC-type phosphate transport system substrate-binding protein
MFRRALWPPILLTLLAIAGEVSAAGDVVVIGNANLIRLDAGTVERIYTGRVIEVDGIPITAVNVASGSPVRSRFLQIYLHQDEDKYTGYWTVRRYNGLGAPPRELPSSAEIINYVKSTPGAIGYIDEADVRPGLNILLKL